LFEYESKFRDILPLPTLLTWHQNTKKIQKRNGSKKNRKKRKENKQ
jgi:hypothetical protein